MSLKPISSQIAASQPMLSPSSTEQALAEVNKLAQDVFGQNLPTELKKDEKMRDIKPVDQKGIHITAETPLTKEEWEKLQIDLSKNPTFDESIESDGKRIVNFFKTNSSAHVELQGRGKTSEDGIKRHVLLIFNGVNLSIGTSSTPPKQERALAKAYIMAIARIEQAMKTYGKSINIKEINITAETPLTKEEWEKLQIDLSKNQKFDPHFPPKERLTKFFETNSSIPVLGEFARLENGGRRWLLTFNGINLATGDSSSTAVSIANGNAMERASRIAITRIKQAMKTYGKPDEGKSTE